LFATTLGDRRFDALVPPVAPQDMAAARARYAALAERTAALGEPADPEAAITWSALGETIRSELAEIDAGTWAWSFDPSDGIPSAFLAVSSYQPLRTPADGDAMVARWHAMARATDAYGANLRESLADGLVACRAPAARVLDILGSVIEEPDD